MLTWLKRILWALANKPIPDDGVSTQGGGGPGEPQK